MLRPYDTPIDETHRRFETTGDLSQQKSATRDEQYEPTWVFDNMSWKTFSKK
jgi:hypothetical protein